MGIESFGENERARGQHEDALKDGYHFDNLHDQNEDEAGEKLNPLDGTQIRNDVDALPKNIKHVSEKELKKHDHIIQELEDDVTTKWFLEQGLDKFGNEIVKDSDINKAA